MTSPNTGYWEIVEYGVDDLGCEYESVISRYLTKLDAEWQVVEMMCHRDDYEEVSYMARKMS